MRTPIRHGGQSIGSGQDGSEFIAYAKANPGKINMASSGNGNSPHISGELFKMMTGVDMVHVPYRGGGARADRSAWADRCRCCFADHASSIEYVRAGKLRALAVTTATRSEACRKFRRSGEIVPGYETSDWFGIGAPKSTPTEIVERLNKEIGGASPIPR